MSDRGDKLLIFATAAAVVGAGVAAWALWPRDEGAARVRRAQREVRADRKRRKAERAAHKASGRARLAAREDAMRARRGLPPRPLSDATFGDAAKCSLQSARKVRKMLGLENGKLPEHVEKFGRYMMYMAGKSLAPADVAKAYLITISSMQRQAQGCDRVRAYWPEVPCADDEQVRPEHVMSQILTSPDGRRYLAAASRGKFDARAASWLAGKFASFGLAEQMMSGLKTAPKLAADAAAVDKIIKTGTRKQWMEYVAKNIKGVSYAKSGFLAAIMGRGDMATADARQIGLWDPEAAYGGKVDALFVETLNHRLKQLDIATPPELQPFYEHLVHHTIWDRMGGGQVFHTEIKDCMAEDASASDRAKFLGSILA